MQRTQGESGVHRGARIAGARAVAAVRVAGSLQGREKVRQVEQSIEQYIREQPLKSMLIAAGVGLVLGRFWMRR